MMDCFGDSTGSATAGATGGTLPYNYLWTTGTTDSTATNLKGVTTLNVKNSLQLIVYHRSGFVCLSGMYTAVPRFSGFLGWIIGLTLSYRS